MLEARSLDFDSAAGADVDANRVEGSRVHQRLDAFEAHVFCAVYRHAGRSGRGLEPVLQGAAGTRTYDPALALGDGDRCSA